MPEKGLDEDLKSLKREIQPPGILFERISVGITGKSLPGKRIFIRKPAVMAAAVLFIIIGAFIPISGTALTQKDPQLKIMLQAEKEYNLAADQLIGDLQSSPFVTSEEVLSLILERIRDMREAIEEVKQIALRYRGGDTVLNKLVCVYREQTKRLAEIKQVLSIR